MKSTSILIGVVAAGAALGGCASVGSDTMAANARSPGPQGIFKAASPYGMTGISAGPRTGWYVPRQAPHYDAVGVASWYPARFRLRLSGAGAAPVPEGVIAEGAALPLPSIVEVTNLETGKSVQVRVDDRAPIAGGLIALDRQAADGLGFARPEATARVRVRYVAPAVLWRQNADLRYAFNWRHGRAAPALAQTAAQVYAAAAPLPAPGPAVIASAAEPPAMAAAAPKLQVARTMDKPARGTLRVQVGAFAKSANAQKAVGMVAAAGPATIEPVRHGGLTLYRVVLETDGGDSRTQSVLAKLSEIGFPDSRVLRAF